MSDKKIKAREQVIQSVLRLVSSERDEPHAHYDDELNYAQDWLDHTAYELAEVIKDEGKGD